jgi:hypothetical protein
MGYVKGVDINALKDGLWCSPDPLFRCKYCIKLIAEGAPVYMWQDHSYCSLACRDSDLSRSLHGDAASRKESQIQEAFDTASDSFCTLNRMSDSSLASKTTRQKGTADPHGKRQPKKGFLGLCGQAILDIVLKRIASKSWGEQVLRTYSSGMLWGQEITKGSSAQRIFSYLPEVDHYLNDSCGSLNHAQSTDHLMSLAAQIY